MAAASAARAPRRSASFCVGGARSTSRETPNSLRECRTCRPGLDVALLPVGGWGRTLGPGHMDPLGAARAAALLQPRIAIPIHWGTFLAIGVGRRHHAQPHDDPRLFAREVANLAPRVEVRILAPGDETTL